MLKNKGLGILLGGVGILCIAMGVIFVTQGFAKSEVITDAMVSANITYSGAGGEITGIIDNAGEAKVMATVLAEHREAMGSYTSLKRDDPNRQTILNAMTMENSLTLAQMGYGLVQVVQATGAFMIVIGVAVGGVAVFVVRGARS